MSAPTLDAAAAHLDAALLALPGITDAAVDRGAVEERLAGALLHVHTVAARGGSAGDRRDLEAATTLARLAAEALQSAPTEDVVALRCLDACAEALRALLAAAPNPIAAPMTPPPTDAPWPRASRGEPRALRVARPLLRPSVPVSPWEPEAPPPPEPAPSPPMDLAALQAQTRLALARLDEDPPARPVPVTPDTPTEPALFGEVLPPYALTLDRARQCVEDLAMFGRMRRATDAEPWCAPRTESRLLARIDGLVACGVEVFGALVHMLGARPVPDPELTWALVMLFGSLEGDDGALQCLRVARSADASLPEMQDALGDALGLAPHPAFDGEGLGAAALRAWLADPLPGRRVIALSALARRDALRLDEVARGFGDDAPEVVRAAAAALPRCSGTPGEAWWSAALQHPDPAVVTAVLRASALRGRPEGLARATALTEGGAGTFGDAAKVLSLAGELSAWDALRAGYARNPDAAALAAFGWFGHRDAIPALLAAMHREALAPTAARALWRITGVALAEGDDRPDALRVEEGFRAPEVPAVWSVDAGAWARALGDAPARMNPLQRWRFGHPWSLEDTLWELEDPASVPPDRRDAHVELVARSGLALPLDLEHFVARQRAQLAAWRSRCEGAVAHTRGQWPAAAFETYSRARRGEATR